MLIILDNLLPTGSEQREVLGFGRIPVAILPSCQDMKTVALQLHRHKCSWVVKIKKKHLRGSARVTILPVAITLSTGIGQYDGLGEYCGPHTASSVFLILELTDTPGLGDVVGVASVADTLVPTHVVLTVTVRADAARLRALVNI